MVSFGISHRGKVRSENQDAYMVLDKPIGNLRNIYIVADGMGGHLGGATASKLCVDTTIQAAENETGLTKGIIKSLINKANLSIYQMAVDNSHLFGMGTTVDLVTIDQGQLFIGHVGDGRVYVVSDEGLQQLSKDHSYVQELVDAGAITEDEAYVHPQKNRITRAVGVDKDLDIDFIDYTFREKDEYLLICSDGLTNMLRDEEISHMIHREGQADKAGKVLLNEALDRGGLDNITLILVDLKGGHYVG